MSQYQLIDENPELSAEDKAMIKQVLAGRVYCFILQGALIKTYKK